MSFDQLLISAAFDLEKLLMIASLGNYPFVENNDFVCVLDRGQSMSNDNNGLRNATLLHDLIESLLNLVL